jgi:hypothetical protein
MQLVNSTQQYIGSPNEIKKSRAIFGGKRSYIYHGTACRHMAARHGGNKYQKLVPWKE